LYSDLMAWMPRSLLASGWMKTISCLGCSTFSPSRVPLKPSVIFYTVLCLFFSESEFVNVQGAQESIPPAYVAWRAGTTNRVIVMAHQATKAGVIGSLESIPGPHKHLKVRALPGRYNKYGYYRNGPPGYISWRNRVLGIDSWAPINIKFGLCT
jgi:hypothetical protein